MKSSSSYMAGKAVVAAWGWAACRMHAGLRIVVSLVYEMARRGLESGRPALCAGGGIGMIPIVTRD